MADCLMAIVSPALFWFGFKKHLATLQKSLEDIQAVLPDEEIESFLDEFKVLGREDDAEALIRSLTGSTSKEKLTIFPIVGIGGIGKTTLAKLVYNDMQIKGHFDVRVWVCVGVKVDDVMTILVKILQSLTESKVKIKPSETVIQSLKEKLGGKKYLLVLDDVWNEEGEFWANFRSCMFNVNEAYGNSIIVTTRSNALATNANQTSMPYSLDQLSDGQCWSTIKERAIFPNGGPTEDLVGGIGQEIARRCCGLPLAAKVVGGILRSKKGVVEWMSVRDSLVQGSSQEDLLDILKLSYDNLPNPLLKHCFSYCSIFRKDTVMEKARLIQLWMALGFLEVEEGARHKDMEEVGHEFFKILVQNSLFHDVEKDDYGNITGCKMHDLVHDLARSISESQCLSLEGSMSNDAIPRVKDLALYNVNEKVVVEVLKQDKAGYLRTLFLEGASSIITEHISLNHFKCLRILNLMDSGLEMLPDSIGELIHLRYLDLSFTRGITVLPKSIGKLYHLQTLRLYIYSYGLRLPNEVGNLISLRHLYIDSRLNIAPFNIGRFTCLRTLEYFRVGLEEGRCIEVLGPLKNLQGMLKLDHLQHVRNKSEALNAGLIGKLALINLEYVWCYRGEGVCRFPWENENNTNAEEVLEGLQAPPNLKVLNIKDYMGDNFPEWVMKMAVIGMDHKLLPLHNLVHITFNNCKKCKRVPMLGQLPHLQELVMWNMKNVRCIDESFYGYSGGRSSCGKPPRVIFPALRILKMHYMENLKTWMDVNVTRKDTIGGGEGSSGSGGGWLVFPHLEELELIKCPMIKSLPYEAFTGAHLSLKRLKTEDCDSLETIPTLQSASVSQLFPHLEELELIKCPMINSLPYEALTGAHLSLKRLEIRRCYNLGTIPTLQGFTSLEHLSILYCEGLASLPELPFHHSLRKLEICGTFEKVICIPEGYLSGVTNTLEELEIGPLSSETQPMKLCLQSILPTPTPTSSHSPSPSTSSSLQQQLQSSPILRKLKLEGQPHWDSIPEEVQHLTALTDLMIDNFGLVEALPDWFAHLSSLEELCLEKCSKLSLLLSTEVMGRLTKLKKIMIDERQLAQGIGPEWLVEDFGFNKGIYRFIKMTKSHQVN